MNLTLNGFMAASDGGLSWHTDFWDDEIARAFTLQLAEADTLLLGRKTYETMAPYWRSIAESINPPRPDADFNDLMLRHEKVIFSRTLTRAAGWGNCRLANRNIAKEIESLKTSNGKDLLIYGSGKLVSSLAKLNLIDEYRLWMHPVAIQKGRSFFGDFTKQPHIKLASSKKFNSGVVLMCYKAG
ncbi:dihydrofolate reductase family protein [Mucilaginibacter conchicola]|nr:dihydrofolate reductase family protein [Mucilaginibacter conchicola]